MEQSLDQIIEDLAALGNRPHPPTLLDWHDFRNDLAAIIHRLEICALDMEGSADHGE